MEQRLNDIKGRGIKLLNNVHGNKKKTLVNILSLVSNRVLSLFNAD